MSVLLLKLNLRKLKLKFLCPILGIKIKIKHLDENFIASLKFDFCPL